MYQLDKEHLFDGRDKERDDVIAHTHFYKNYVLTDTTTK